MISVAYKIDNDITMIAIVAFICISHTSGALMRNIMHYKMSSIKTKNPEYGLFVLRAVCVLKYFVIRTRQEVSVTLSLTRRTADTWLLNHENKLMIKTS